MNRFEFKLLVVGLTMMCGSSLFGDNVTWLGTVDGDPTKVGNWSGTTGCGSLTDGTNRDNATFRGAPAATTLVPSQDWFIGSMFFQDYGGLAAQWKVGAGAADATPIYLAGIGSGSIDLSHSAGITDFTVDLAGPLVMTNNYQISCNSSEPSNALKIGRVSGKGDLQLKGSGNRGIVYGPLSDHAGGTLGISKLHDGVWTVGGTNTFTGAIVISRGTIIVAGDVAKSGVAGPLGANSSYTSGLGVRVGDPNPSVTNFSALLLGYNPDGTPVTFARETTSQQNNKIADPAKNQLAHFGGANTNGVTKFTATVRSYRPCVLKCAAGGVVDFVGTFNSYDRAVAIGTSDFTGTVRLEQSLTTAAGVTCEYGTLDMCAELKAATTVKSGAALTSSSATKGIVSGALTVEEGGVLAGTEGGLLQINGALSLATGAVIRSPVALRGNALISVASSLSLSGVKVRLDNPEARPQGRFPILTATGGLTDATAVDASELPKLYKVEVIGNTLYGRYVPGLIFHLQ